MEEARPDRGHRLIRVDRGKRSAASIRSLVQRACPPWRMDPREDRSRRGASLVGAGAGFVKPMECTPVDEIPDDASKWIYEVKLDGYRCCAIVKKGKAFLYSRY